MKIEISMENGLLHDAERTARRMGLSRGRLFALAVGDFLERQRKEKTLLRLNAVYTKGLAPVEIRQLTGIKSKVRAIVKGRW
jgi:hypothetical protein